MPRMFAVNHHPEIVDRFRQVMILSQKRDRGEVSEQWYKERLEILTGSLPDEDVDRRLHLTSDFTLLGPLRFHLFRQIRTFGTHVDDVNAKLRCFFACGNSHAVHDVFTLI